MSLDLNKPIETAFGTEAYIVTKLPKKTSWDIYLVVYKNEFKRWTIDEYCLESLKRDFRNKKEKKVAVIYLNIDHEGSCSIYREESSALSWAEDHWPVRARRVEFEYEI